MQYVPVVDSNQRPLMPTTPARAERWIKSGKATPFFRKGIFCVRLNVEPSARNLQPIESREYYSAETEN
jgi:RRXRR protein